MEGSDRVERIYVVLSWAVALATIVVLALLLGCGRGAIQCPTAATNTKSDAPQAKPACPTPTHYWTSCISEEPPTEPTLMGDIDIDRARKEDHRRKLVAWSTTWYVACGKRP